MLVRIKLYWLNIWYRIIMATRDASTNNFVKSERYFVISEN